LKHWRIENIDRDDITGAIPAGGGCSGSKCDDLVAIVCTR
jgi:hypothetical protein